MAEPNYDINYDDKRFTEVESDKTAALKEVDTTYDGMIGDSDKYFKDQADAVKKWEKTQKENQQAQTDFAIEKINQQKDQTKKDYTKEQSGAYADWQKQSNQYGANAEQRAAGGLAGAGYSESAQVAMYNQYQARVTAARESYNRAVLNYDNAIKDAQLQNNSALAEIAFNSLQKQLELSLQGFQYKNSLIIEKANKKVETEDRYYGRWQDVLKQINQENALAETVRQHNATIAAQNASLALDREKFEWQKAQAASGGSGGGGGGGSGGGIDKDTDKKGNDTEIKDTGKEEIKENSNEKDLPVDTRSLVAAGLAGASAKKIAEEIAAGRLTESVVNGKLTYKRVFAPVSKPAKTVAATKKPTSSSAKNRIILKNSLRFK